MRSLVLKALSRSLQVEFTYIKSGKQVRFMADSNIKNPIRSLSLSLPLFTPSPSPFFSLYHADSSACSWLLMCGSRAGWKTYCSINHVPFFSATRGDSEGSSQTGATLSRPPKKTHKNDKISPRTDSELRLRQTVPIPIT